MNENKMIKLIKYMKEVYAIDYYLDKLSDSRVNPSYTTSEVSTILLFGFLLRIKSFEMFDEMIKQDFKKLFPRKHKLPSVDTMRDTLKLIDLEGLANMNKSIVHTTIKNRVFEQGTIDGYVVAAIDGTGIFDSKKKQCEKCLNYEMRGTSHHAHKAVVASLVGNTIPLVLDFEMYNNNIDSSNKEDGELTVAKRLITRLTHQYKDFIDIVAYDALACNSVMVNHILNHNLDFVIKVKKNNNNSINEVKSIVNKKEPSTSWYEGDTLIEAFEDELYMNNVDQRLRFVKFTRKHKDDSRSQELLITSCLDLNLQTLFKIVKSRWHIENRIFNNLKTHCSLEHCFVHGGNEIEAVLYLIFISSNVFQLYRTRRIRNHKKPQYAIVDDLRRGLMLMEYDKDLIFRFG